MALTFREMKNIGVVTFDHDDSKVNILSGDVLSRLNTMIDEISLKKDLKALLFVSKKKDCFVAGADISEIEAIVEPSDGAAKAKYGQDVFNKIEDLTLPTIAVIDGVALGGGCELALACRYRVATFNPKVRIGLPEVNLGFVPGFGGTYRLPRIVGLQESLKMILSGKPIDSTKALKIGLFDRLFPQKNLDHSLDIYVDEIIKTHAQRRRYQRKPKKGLAEFLDSTRLGHSVVFKESLKGVMKMSKGFYPAPLKAIEVVKKNFYMDRERGLLLENQAFGELAVTDISKNLVKLFYMSEKFRKLSVDGADQVSPMAIHHCGVLGAGVMGGGIAQLLSSRGIWCRLKDLNHAALALGYQSAGKVYDQATKKRKYTKAEARAMMSHITGTLDYKGFKNADIVIEAVVENMDVKKKVLQELCDHVKPEAIIATNTSALSVTEMATVVKDPSKMIGFHFFNPVHRMPLVELITTEKTSTETLVSSLKLVQRLGKTPIVVKDSCGFIVNRILLAYINEAGRLLEETGQLEQIDRVMLTFGMPMGPFLLSDEVGLDVGVKVLHILEAGLGERFKAVSIFDKIYETGLLGKKSGKGYYIHGKKRLINQSVFGMLPGGQKALNHKKALERLIYIMVNEAALCLDEGIVDGPEAIDIGMIFGTGFPPFRGGLLRYADHIGINNIVSSLEELSKELNADRFKPVSYLAKLKEEGKGFYSK